MVLGLMGWIAYWLRFGEWTLPAEYAAFFMGGLLLAGLIMPLAGLYDSWRGSRVIRIAANAVLAWSVTFAVVLIALWATHSADDLSRLWLGYWGLFGATGVGLVRVTAYLGAAWLRKRGFNTRKVLVFGAGGLGQRVVQATDEHGWTGFQLVAILDDDSAKAGNLIGHLRVRTDTARLDELVDELRVDEVWLALPLRAEDRVRQILDVLRHSTVNVRLMPDVFGLRLLNHSITEIAGIGTLNLTETPFHGWNRVLKGVEDRALGALAFLVLLPLMIAIAVAIRISMGSPVLFRQERHGWDGLPITVYKFRTMKHAACNGAVRQAKRDDARVTRLGALLRRTSLDEIPQVFNVLNGTMSLVGPRPHALEHNQYYMERIDDYMKRHCVKPGITGWAQVNGFRGETETVEKMRQRVEYDLFYIENWSVGFDLRIIVRTIGHLMSRENAY
jgi:putative colanic acid biosynthesis UDP-glucose lipid carrier transferase